MSIDLQALYPRLINLMLDTVFVVDTNNHIAFVSDACEALLGYRAVGPKRWERVSGWRGT